MKLLLNEDKEESASGRVLSSASLVVQSDRWLDDTLSYDELNDSINGSC